jgi:hypothetical protein
LAPYRYSIAYENFSNDYYWTEKVADALLAWAMPVYFGCSDLGRFLPRASYVRLDPTWRDPVSELKRIIDSDVRERNLDAIAEARDLILNRYNWHELIASRIDFTSDSHREANVKHAGVRLRDHTEPRGGRFRRFLPKPVRRLAKALLDV